MPRKLEPGFEATNSKLRDLITSTMKSEPERSRTEIISTSPLGSASGRGTAGSFAAGCAASWARAVPEPATRVAIPPTAAVFRNLRRSRPLFFDFDMNYPRRYGFGQKGVLLFGGDTTFL